MSLNSRRKKRLYIKKSQIKNKERSIVMRRNSKNMKDILEMKKERKGEGRKEVGGEREKGGRKNTKKKKREASK